MRVHCQWHAPPDPQLGVGLSSALTHDCFLVCVHHSPEAKYVHTHFKVSF